MCDAFREALTEPTPLYPAVAQLLIDTFGKSPDIEDVITELALRIESLKEAQTVEDRAERMTLGNCRGFLNASLREWFREIRGFHLGIYSFPQRVAR
jgi:hypothetical protein